MAMIIWTCDVSTTLEKVETNPKLHDVNANSMSITFKNVKASFFFLTEMRNTFNVWWLDYLILV